MKALLVLVSAAALAATAATVVLGARLAEPTVVENPYEAGLRYDAERRANAAAASKPERQTLPGSAGRAAPPGSAGDGELALEISPRPPRAMTELELVVRATRAGRPLDGAAVSVSFSMPGMRMGENRVLLRAAGDGTYRGKGVVVRCPSGGRAWNADVRAVPVAGPELERRFAFEVAAP